MKGVKRVRWRVRSGGRRDGDTAQRAHVSLLIFAFGNVHGQTCTWLFFYLYNFRVRTLSSAHLPWLPALYIIDPAAPSCPWIDCIVNCVAGNYPNIVG